MTAVPFDTLQLARDLEAAGFPPKQAQDTVSALANAFKDQIATKDDVASLRRDSEVAKHELKVWAATMSGLLFAALSAIKFFGH